MKKIRNTSVIVLALMLSLSACNKDYLNTTPSDQIDFSDAFTSVANARSAMNGVYRSIYMQYSTQSEDGQGAIMINLDFMGEDIVHSAAGTSYFRNAYKWVDHRSVSSDLTTFAFRFPYKIISNVNLVIDNVDPIIGNINEKNGIKGEAFALRAWSYFQLVQLFGLRYDATTVPNTQLGVPLFLHFSTQAQARATVEEVYTQINSDLDSAINRLSYANTRSIKSHIDLSVAKGIKARVALTMQDYLKAAQYASEARANYTLMTNSEYTQGFTDMGLPGQGEWMWAAHQLADQLPAYGSFYAYMSSNFNSAHTRPNPKLINSALYTALSATDIRKKLWWDGTTADAVNFKGIINSATFLPEPTQVKKKYQHRKYVVKDPGVSAGDIPFMRAAEMYLIEAEAYARLNRMTDAFNAIKPLAINRDPLFAKTASNLTLDDIMVQRRAELWGEGFRFLDLKRTNSALNRANTGATTTLATTGVSTPVPAGDVRWQFMIPRREIEANPFIIQNQ